jgi:RNA polymerase-binding transcription factor DksA
MQNFPSDMLNDIRVALEEEKKSINARISELSAQDPFSDPNRLDDNAASDGEANEESSHDRFTALVSELQQKVTNIDATLFRISDGTYGICTNCKKTIDADRLSILPTASLCLTCEQTKKRCDA